MQQKIEKMEEELMKVQTKYQKELRKQLLLKGQSGSSNRKIKVRYFFLLHICDKLQNMNDMISHFRTL